MDNKISIVVPVYNSSEFLRDCIESIINQTYSNIEVILVDDESTDDSLSICFNYAKKDSRIRVIPQKHSGTGMTRNAGIKVATGDFVGFVDSDDWIDSNMYEWMITKQIETGADVVACGINHHFLNRVDSRELHQEYIFNRKDALYNILTNTMFGGYLVNKLFKKELINKISFEPGVNSREDILFCTKAVACSEKIYFETNNLYNYRRVRKGNSGTDLSRYYTTMLAWEKMRLVIHNAESEFENYVVLLSCEAAIDCYHVGQLNGDFHNKQYKKQALKLYHEIGSDDIDKKEKIKVLLKIIIPISIWKIYWKIIGLR